MAFWQRYPNPNSKHVLSEDTLSREIKNDLLITKRLLTKTNKLPKWGERFIPGSSRSICILEESIVDLKTKTITTYSRNIGMSKILTVDEKCQYKVDPENNSRTKCIREAWIESHVYGFARAIQHFGIERFKQNISKTVKGFEYVMESLYAPKIMDSVAHPESRTEKIRTTAKKATEKATEIARSKAGQTMVASCTGQTPA